MTGLSWEPDGAMSWNASRLSAPPSRPFSRKTHMFPGRLLAPSYGDQETRAKLDRSLSQYINATVTVPPTQPDPGAPVEKLMTAEVELPIGRACWWQ